MATTVKTVKTVKPHTQVEVSSLPSCDICKYEYQKSVPNVAQYDGRVNGQSAWANMCPSCFKTHGAGLGLGKGQKLILKK